MVKILTFFIAICLIFGCKNEEKSLFETHNTPENSQNAEENFGILIHDDAGTILKENMSDSLEAAKKPN